MTKAQQVYERVEAMVAEGTSRPDAFKQLAAELKIQPNSVRGSYYSGRPDAAGGPKRPRRRWTTPEDAVADALRVLEAAREAIDVEVEAAKARAAEAAAEHKAMAEAAPKRKEEIQARIDALT
ncbi:MAG TPA: hypothetical protein VFF79_09230 [Conexibacter sp.]|jgi:hypothetical protein|nr:hypothetical protein [Conexibacter sp.]